MSRRVDIFSLCCVTGLGARKSLFHCIDRRRYFLPPAGASGTWHYSLLRLNLCASSSSRFFLTRSLEPCWPEVRCNSTWVRFFAKSLFNLSLRTAAADAAERGGGDRGAAGRFGLADISPGLSPASLGGIPGGGLSFSSSCDFRLAINHPDEERRKDRFGSAGVDSDFVLAAYCP